MANPTYILNRRYCSWLAELLYTVYIILCSFITLLLFLLQSHQNAGYNLETENPLEATPPAPYNYSDHVSEADTEVSNRLQIVQTPKFGESYSQSGYSPVMPRSQGKASSASSNTMVKTNLPEGGTGKGGEEEDMEFMDNDAYETFTIPTRFEIVGKERGKVFETVKVK